MKKKKSGGGGANWMDTYGDMVTLLLCFFVLLYSMSTISEEKWRAIITSFNPFAQLTPTESSGNDGPVADPSDGQGGEPSIPDVAAQREIDEDMESLFVALMQYAQSEGLEDTLNIEKGGGKVYVKLNQNVMFPPDKPDLLPAGQEVLTRIAAMLDEVSGSIEEINIQGHTARYVYDRPNPEVEDWRLSSNRALNVQIFLWQNMEKVHPSRLITESCGQWRPEGDNKNEEGRAINRRVVLIISGRNIEEELKGNSIAQIYIDKLGETP